MNVEGPIHLHYIDSQRWIVFIKKSLFIFHRRKQVHIHVRWHEGEEMMREFSFLCGISV